MDVPQSCKPLKILQTVHLVDPVQKMFQCLSIICSVSTFKPQHCFKKHWTITCKKSPQQKTHYLNEFNSPASGLFLQQLN